MPEDELSWDLVRNAIQSIAESRGEHGGYPMPIPGIKLAIEPNHPLKKRLEAAEMPRNEPAEVPALREVGGDGHRPIYNNGCEKKLGLAGVDALRRFYMWLATLDVATSGAWSPACEVRAMTKLREMVGEHKFGLYLMTGTFLESSPRSGVVYVFRRLRPTLALRPNEDGNMAIIACLCLHPIGYYEGTWAGSMVPTDDVIAHLTLMRGDEHKFWCKANQHDFRTPEAGL